MTVPAPSIAPALIAGSTNNLLYFGEVGVAGAAVDLNIDLTAFPEYIRKETRFRDALLVTVKSLDANFSFAGPAILTDSDFGEDTEVNEWVTIQVTSDVDTRQCLILLEHRHTATR